MIIKIKWTTNVLLILTQYWQKIAWETVITVSFRKNRSVKVTTNCGANTRYVPFQNSLSLLAFFPLFPASLFYSVDCQQRDHYWKAAPWIIPRNNASRSIKMRCWILIYCKLTDPALPLNQHIYCCHAMRIVRGRRCDTTQPQCCK